MNLAQWKYDRSRIVYALGFAPIWRQSAISGHPDPLFQSSRSRLVYTMNLYKAHLEMPAYTLAKNMFVGLLFLIASQSSWGKTAYSVQVTLGTQVVQKMSSSSPAERKRISEAIQIGNRFINARLAFSDNTISPESEEQWERDIGPLMAMHFDDWEKVWEREGWTIYAPMADQNQNGFLLSCPTIKLVNVTVSGQEVLLIYHSPLLGVLNVSRPLPIDTSRRGQPYRMEIRLNAFNKITAVATQEKTVALNYFGELDRARRTINRWSVKEETLSKTLSAELAQAKQRARFIEDAAAGCADVK